MKVRHERLTAVALGAVIVVGLGSAGAVAAKMITSQDIKNDTIRSIDINDGAVKEGDISPRTRRNLQGERGPKGPPGESATYQGVNWSVLDRNTIGNGDAFLRAGPSTAAFGADQDPPSGVGSLALRTGSGSDKAAFGNQVDFVGDPLDGIDTASYSVFTTGENRAVAPGNLPNLAMEIDPTGVEDDTSPNYSTLVFVPEDAAANEWTFLDASTAQRWYLTGAAGTASGCNQTTYCTLEDVKAALPEATLHTVQLTKGRDSAFSGAVDALELNDTTYDFEPFGVVEN